MRIDQMKREQMCCIRGQEKGEKKVCVYFSLYWENERAQKTIVLHPFFLTIFMEEESEKNNEPTDLD